MKRILLAFGLLALAAISTACSSAAAQPVASGPVDPNGPTIVAKDMKFAGGPVEVKAGANVTLHFDNQDSAPHNVAKRSGPGATFRSPVKLHGSTWTHKFTRGGTYKLVCTIHAGMKLTVKVR